MCLGLVKTSGLNTCLMSRNGLITLHVRCLQSNSLLSVLLFCEMSQWCLSSVYGSTRITLRFVQHNNFKPVYFHCSDGLWKAMPSESPRRRFRSLLLCTSDVFRALIRDTLCLPVVPNSSRPRSVSDYELRGKEKQHIYVGADNICL